MNGAVAALLRRDRWLSLAVLAVLAILAWGWLLAGAGMAMPDAMAGMAMPPPAPWTAPHFALVLAMWWTMMVAMMLPSAAPVVLLHARVARNGLPASAPPTAWFLAGYLAAWGAFSLLAALLHLALESSGVLDATSLRASGWQAGAILIATGAWQLSPAKNACLSRCRNPAAFLAAHYRPGAAGALRMGLVHGAYCVGCCWLLMALLFAGGVMNLAWIAALTLLVAAEKLLPGGRVVALVAGVACLAWGAVLVA